jgi:protein pelota
VTNENDYVKLGAYHTLDLEGELASTRRLPFVRAHLGHIPANRDFRLYKASGWDSVSLERIEEATKEGRGADVGAVVLGEGQHCVPRRSSLCMMLMLLTYRARNDMPALGAYDRDSAADRYFSSS